MGDEQEDCLAKLYNLLRSLKNGTTDDFLDEAFENTYGPLADAVCPYARYIIFPFKSATGWVNG